MDQALRSLRAPATAPSSALSATTAGGLDYLSYEPLPSGADLKTALGDTQWRTMRVFDQFIKLAAPMPKLPIVNPPLWELGHVAWFQEFWVHRRGDIARPSKLRNADALFNSSQVPHDSRWDLPLPPVPALRDYLSNVFEDTITLLNKLAMRPDPAAVYFIQLAIFHQDMHNEAFAYSWQTAGWPTPGDLPVYGAPVISYPVSKPLPVAAADIDVGARSGDGFVFDNEKWSHRVHVPAFTIDSAPVSNGAYLEYVEGDRKNRTPRYWRHADGQWQHRVHRQWVSLDRAAPVCHVSADEADAYCRWRKRRLPTEFEWLRLATVAPALTVSHVWEWTSSIFEPFPGFSPDPYADYSRPWFDGRYRVLKGGSRWTPPRLRRAGFRNFYLPDRGDIYSGFRTCAIESS